MSQGTEPNPARRRAGLLSALSRQYNDAHRLMNQGASSEEINQLKTKARLGLCLLQVVVTLHLQPLGLRELVL